MMIEGSQDGLDCSDADASVYCFRVRKYEGGKFRCIYHAHIPRHRISKENRASLLRCLKAKYDPVSDEEMTRSFLNKTGKRPQRSSKLDITVSHNLPNATWFVLGGDIEASYVMRHASAN